MKRNLILLLTVVALPLAGLARTNYATVKTTLGKDGERKTSVSLKTDKSKIEAGYTTSPKHAAFDAYWRKSDVSGNKVSIEAHQHDRLSYGYYYQQNADGRSIVAGYLNPELSVADDAFLLMKSSRGNSVWFHKTGGSPDLDALFQQVAPPRSDSSLSKPSRMSGDDLNLESLLSETISREVRALITELMPQ